MSRKTPLCVLKKFPADDYNDEDDDSFHVPVNQNNLGNDVQENFDIPNENLVDDSDSDELDSVNDDSDNDDDDAPGDDLDIDQIEEDHIDNQPDNDPVVEHQGRESPVLNQEAEPDLDGFSLEDQDSLPEIGGENLMTSPQAGGSKVDLAPGGGDAISGQATPTVQNRPSRSRDNASKSRQERSVSFQDGHTVRTYLSPQRPYRNISFDTHHEEQTFSPNNPPTTIRRGRSAGRAPEVPFVLPAQIERSSQLRRNLTEIHEQHRRQLQLDSPPTRQQRIENNRQQFEDQVLENRADASASDNRQQHHQLQRHTPQREQSPTPQNNNSRCYQQMIRAD